MHREGLEVTPLTRSVQRVEDQRTLAAARHASHDRQFAVRDLDRDAIEIVFPNILQMNPWGGTLARAYRQSDSVKGS